MTRGRRTIRRLKWAGVGLCVLIAATWAVSMWWAVGVDALPGYMTTIESGGFGVGWTPNPAGKPEWIFVPAVSQSRTPQIELERNSVYSAVFIPLWLPLGVLALPTALLFWLDRRKPRPGFCACGYDLTGNVSGVCPECGQGIA